MDFYIHVYTQVPKLIFYHIIPYCVTYLNIILRVCDEKTHFLSWLVKVEHQRLISFCLKFAQSKLDLTLLCHDKLCVVYLV